MRNRKHLKEQSKDATPEPEEEPVPVGGFLLRAKVEDWPDITGPFPHSEFYRHYHETWGKFVYVFSNRSVMITLNVKNILEHPLRVWTEHGDDRDFVIDISGGPIVRESSNELEETLSQIPPFTAYGSTLYTEFAHGMTGVYSPWGWGQPLRKIAPGESLTYRVSVDQVYDLSRGGLYRIAVRHRFPIDPKADYEVARLNRAYSVSNPVYVCFERDAVREIYSVP